MKRFLRSAPICAAAAALVLAAAAGCSAAPGTAPFSGYKWRVIEIDHGGKRTPIPASYAVYLKFAPGGQFGANDPVNYSSGTYQQGSGGFTTRGIASTAAGYAGHDPVLLLSVAAISAFGDDVHAAASLASNQLAVTVGGYLLTCRRDGPAGP